MAYLFWAVFGLPEDSDRFLKNDNELLVVKGERDAELRPS
jgi:hypothetical protein